MKKIIRIVALSFILMIPFAIKAEGITQDSLRESYKNIIACTQEKNHTTKTVTKTLEDGSVETTTKTICNEEMDYTGIDMDEYMTFGKSLSIGNGPQC